MKRIAIISFNHQESSLCLAKYIAKQGCMVDWYFINRPYWRGRVSGFEFWRGNANWGLHPLEANEIPEIKDYMGDYNVQLYLITFDSSRRYSFLGLDKLTLWYACREIQKRRYDAIDIIGQTDYIKLCHQCLRKENITHTYHEVGSHQNNISSTPSVDISIKDNSKVILHSRSTYQRYISLPGVDKQKAHIIPFGKFETSLLYGKKETMDIPLDLNKPTFLFFGMIRPYKGLDILAESMKILKPYYKRFNLIVAGGGDDPNLSFFDSLSNCFVYNHFLENDEMMQLISICSVVVLPYHTASQTGIIPTIALYGKPAIATNVGAFPELIENGKNGLLVDKENPTSFAEAMFSCIDNSQVLESLTEGMRSFGVGDRWDWNTIAKQTLDILYD